MLKDGPFCLIYEEEDEGNERYATALDGNMGQSEFMFRLSYNLVLRLQVSQKKRRQVSRRLR